MKQPVMPPLPRAALLDWDNTLVDTWPVIHDAMNTTLAHMGHALWTLEETHARVRRALREAFPELFGARWEEARDVFYRRFREIHLDRLAIRPGADKLLSALHGKGVYLGVVSNKSGDHLRSEATHLGWDRYFGRVVGATDAPRDKPAPEPVHLALAGSGVPAGRDVWFIGDTGIDMECAYNANCVAILVRENPPTDLEFSIFPPEFHATDCAALAALVMRL
jgi:phosphoglycolate phosphatase